MSRGVHSSTGEDQVWGEQLQAWYFKATAWLKAYRTWSVTAQEWYWEALAWHEGRAWPGDHPPYTPGGVQLEPPPAPPEGLDFEVAPEDPRRLVSRGKGVQ